MKIDHSKPPNEKMIVNIRDVKSTFPNLLCCVGIGVGIRSIFEVHVTDIVVSTADGYNIWHLFLLHTCSFNCTPNVSQEHLYVMYPCVSKYGHLCLDISGNMPQVLSSIRYVLCTML